MASSKALKLARKSVLQQRDMLQDLEALVKSIERGEKMIFELKEEMDAVNATHGDRKTTREDIAYLEDLLRCAKKKLAWEKQMESLSRRIPEALAQVTAVMNDPRNPPADDIRAHVLGSLQKVQAAMARLEEAKGT
jgi:hypothetical protein